MPDSSSQATAGSCYYQLPPALLTVYSRLRGVPLPLPRLGLPARRPADTTSGHRCPRGADTDTHRHAAATGASGGRPLTRTRSPLTACARAPGGTLACSRTSWLAQPANREAEGDVSVGRYIKRRAAVFVTDHCFGFTMLFAQSTPSSGHSPYCPAAVARPVYPGRSDR